MQSNNLADSRTVGYRRKAMSTATTERLWQRSRQRIYFQNDDMDYYLSWALAYSTYSGAQHGECLHTASRIKDGDPDSWAAEWQEEARRVEAVALHSLEGGHLVSAREAYLRAFTYYRLASVGMRPREVRFYETWQDLLSCFRMAAALFNPPIQYIEVPFGASTLPGYFMRVDHSGEKRPTLIIIGGWETFAEDLYFLGGEPGVRRGYNVLFVDLPGQGGTPFTYQFLAPDTEVPLKAVVDYALSLPVVDPDRLALYGLGGGGYMVSRAAAGDKRVKALVANAPVVDVCRLLMAEIPHPFQEGPEFAGDALVRAAGYANPFMSIRLDKLCWQAGAHSFDETLDRVHCATLENLVGEISCPVLCLVSEGEPAEQMAQAESFYNSLEAPARLHIFSPGEGADAHCQVNNLSLMHQVVFDWLDEVFAAVPAEPEEYSYARL